MEQAAADFAALRESLVAAFEALEGGRFRRDKWKSALGAGESAVIEDGAFFERAGINFSRVAGARLPSAALAGRDSAFAGRASALADRASALADRAFTACGVSAVFHPRNPYCPTAHLNARFFAVGDKWWFGGGIDLTPYYGFVADCAGFHRACKTALDALDARLYPRFKRQCDEYFFLPHRGEARGIGGVFFDDFRARGFDFSRQVALAVGGAFVPAVLPIWRRRKNRAYGRRERDFQLLRRGRYVEFNLTRDRGTLFGLQSGGRAESILISMPPAARWRYQSRPQTAAEARLTRDFLPPRDWAGDETAAKNRARGE